MLDDRVCPSCQVVLPAGRSTCPKCGRTVQALKSGFAFLDVPPKIYAWLVDSFGPVGAGIVAGVAFLLLLLLFLGWAVMKSIHAP
jgi:hypothetical protein